MKKKFPWYTGAGDDGSTGLLGQGRVPKYHDQPEAFGAVDEASCFIGAARAAVDDAEVGEALLRIQRDLYAMMAELAAGASEQERFRGITDAHVTWLSAQTDRFGERVQMPREFVVPGDSSAGAWLDVARTVTRRAERRVARLVDDGTVQNRAILGYLNRLSSLLFVLARHTDALAGKGSPTPAKTRPRKKR
ncbi:MAG: cob(I)yrinic acid a,c-diamide adenosyltransferase [Candidatus Krumholzibacteria bacterium]|nr:cob(I)yrinic acid a,c-diamide adenosyltransferase [Candidatus Krumholzibacteria bacterium]